MTIFGKSKRELGMGLSIAVTVTVLMIYLINGFEWLELRTYDARMQFRGPQSLETPILMVMNDEQTITHLGIRPGEVSRNIYAKLIDNVSRAGAKLIVFDVMFSGTTTPFADQEMTTAMRKAGNMILARYISEGGQVVPSAPLRAVEVGEGLINVSLDSDGVLRSVPLLGLSYDNEQLTPFLTLGVEAARLYADQKGDWSLNLDKPNVAKLGPFDIPYPNGNMLINYYGPSGTFPSMPLWQAVLGKFDPGLVRDKIVLVGAKASTLHDFYQTPFVKQTVSTLTGKENRMKGVLMTGLETHANVIQTILDQSFLMRSSHAFVIFLIGVLGFGCSIIMIMVPQNALQVTGIGISLLLTVVVAAIFLLTTQQYWLDMVPLVSLVNGHYGIGMTYQRYLLIRQKNRLRSMFSQYVSPQVAHLLWEQRSQLLVGDRLHPQYLTITTLIAKLEGFSEATNAVSQDNLLNWTNSYLDGMCQVVMEHEGMIEDYGDGMIRAHFGIPLPRNSKEEIRQDARNAVRCAFALEHVVEAINRKWEEQDIPTLALRVVLGTGAAVAGSVGHGERLKYMIMGEAVQTALCIQENTVHSEREEAASQVFSGKTTVEYLDGEWKTTEVGHMNQARSCSSIPTYRFFDAPPDDPKNMHGGQ
ncbi:MAG: CHASE2 domain-containing protein [Nitrospirales bacterium]|nr:CHASE2 domain-containing protein [Nitrospirales bacterium]